MRLVETPELIRQPLIRAAATGALGRPKETKPFLAELLEVNPDFRERPREYLQPLFVTDLHMDRVMDGLSKAGL